MTRSLWAQLFGIISVCLLVQDNLTEAARWYPFPVPPNPGVPKGPVTGGYIVVATDSSMKGNAKCSGKNDEDVINAAIRKSNLVTLSDGVFHISMNILLRSGVTLQGQGMNKTILRLVDNAPAWRTAGMIRGREVSDTTLQFLTLDGNRHKQSDSKKRNYGKFGYYCEVCTTMIIQHVRATRFHEYGLDPHGKKGEPRYSKNLLVRYCLLEENGTCGIAVDKTQNAVVEYTTSRNNMRHGIQVVTGSKNVRVRDNNVYSNGSPEFEKQNGCGIAVNNQENAGRRWGTSDVLIANNVVSDSLRSAVCIFNSDKVEVRGNRLTARQKESCIKYHNADYGTVKDNKCNTNVMISGDYKKSTYTVDNEGLVIFLDD